MPSAAPVAIESPAPEPRQPLRAAELVAMAGLAALMVAATGLAWWPIGWVEVAGFVTGGVCVWLTVREHVANFPVGLANNAAFLLLFWQGRLFADAGLQIVYFGLGVYGWWNWLHGGTGRGPLTISRIPRAEILFFLLVIPLATWLLRLALIAVQGAAPFLDALTTVLSLVAQTLLCRKRLEHWLVWMAADVIYVPLYLSRQLPLTAALYFVFLVMCVIGWRQWRRAT